MPRHSHVALGNLSGVCSGVRSLGMRGVACLLLLQIEEECFHVSRRSIGDVVEGLIM